MNYSTILTDDNAVKVADEIVISLENQADLTNLDFDFSVEKGKMVSKFENTFFLLNPTEDSFLKGFIKSLQEDVITMEKITDEKEKETAYDDFIDGVGKFQGKTINALIKIIDRVRPVIRKVILNNASEIVFPLSTIKITKLVIDPFFDTESGGYSLNIKKLVNKNDPSRRSLSQELINTRIETGESYEAILKRKQDEGDKDFLNVESITKKYYEAEYYLSLWVDYSPIPLAQLNQIIASNPVPVVPTTPPSTI